MAMRQISVTDESRRPLATVLWLAWPVFVEQLLVSLVHSVDTAMVGSLGASATASVSISQSPMMLINGIVMTFGIGFTALIARNVGAKDFDRARQLVRQAMTTVVLLGVPLAAICFSLSEKIPQWMGAAPDVLVLATGYNKIVALSMAFRSLSMVLTAIYRGYGDTRTPMVLNILVNVGNVMGNYLLINPTHSVTLLGNTFTVWGAGWGVAGAAASTSGTAIIGSLVLITLTFTRPGPMKISFKESFRPDREVLRQVSAISVPAMFERFTMSGASVVVAAVVASLGTIAIASNSIAGTAESFCFMPGMAFGTAATTLTGQCLGAMRSDLAEKFVKTCRNMGAVIMAVFCTVLFVFSTPIIGLFTRDAQVIHTASGLLKILATIQVPYLISQVYAGALRGAGDTKGPFYITLVSMWGIRILGSLIAVRVLHYGIYAVVVCMSVDNVVRMVLFWLRYKAGVWKRLGHLR